ncbi:4a-hydroxytetrahydrobiopterin dehydratase [Aeromicrobium sp. CF3.5]|uniref:4a-hydroxytetrahydrobiopterin dehydratase n=1 Tax=Aeromicrobium sp. CF3.5 TaxID=3373078 RepID=UPI003EE601CE
MSDPKQVLDEAQVRAEQLSDWRWSDGALSATFGTGTFATGLQLVARLGEAAEAANHHPDVELTYPSVTVRLTSHDVGGVTSRDTDLAHAISTFARELEADASS